MITNLHQVRDAIREYSVKKLAVAAGTDEHTLIAVCKARDENIATAVITGDENLIRANAEKNKLDLNSIEILHEPDPVTAGRRAVELVSSGKAHIFMKGYIHSDDFLRAVLDKEIGLRAENILNHVFILDATHLGRLLFVTDGAMNIKPNLEEKARIISNTIALAKMFGVETPRVAVLSAVEVVSPKIESTLDAAALGKMFDRGQFSDGIVDGPFALDNAINADAARYKRIGGEVAGRADILVVPNIEAGNMLAKCFTHIADGATAGLIFGAKAPIVLPSRSDPMESKLMGIACAAYIAESKVQKRVKIGKVHF